jgi:hypothetical protein
MSFWFGDSHEWHWFLPLFKKQDINTGAWLTGQCWRRKVKGKWQYRAMTEDEEAEWVSCDVW